MNCHGIPDLEHLEEWTALGIPFEYNDFMLPGLLDDRDETQRRVQAYLSVDRDRSGIRCTGRFWISQFIPAIA